VCRRWAFRGFPDEPPLAQLAAAIRRRGDRHLPPPTAEPPIPTAKRTLQIAGAFDGHTEGRYDVVCPMDSAWALHRAWPEARLVVVADAGHAASEPGTAAALVAATNGFARLA